MSSAESSSASASSKIFKSSKTRKLLLRLAIWDIYNEVYLSKHSLYSSYTMDEKLNKSKEMLIQLLNGQRNYQTQVDIIFPEPIEYWENLITNIRSFENDLGGPPSLEMKEIIVSKTSRKIKAYTSTDKGLDTVVDCFSDPFTLASELMIQHRLPSEELDYIHGMIQHEMVDLVRGAVDAQRESLKKIQFKIATVEHLTLLSETICSKYQQLKQSYESTSKKSMKGTPATTATPHRNSQGYPSTTRQNQSSGSVPTTNRTCLHFNKLIIDERRKLETLEKKIKDAMKSLGRLEPHEVYEDPEGRSDDNHSDSQRQMSSGMNESKQPFTPPLRRASVSLRQALSTTPTTPDIQQRTPFQSFPEGDEDDEGSGIGEGKLFSRTSSSKKPLSLSASFRNDPTPESMNTIGLTKHEIDRKLLFKKSESDRLQLIEENRRLRGEITQVTSRIYEHPGKGEDHTSDNLTYVISELNCWDVERDELDAQIDRLAAQKEALIQKLIATSRGSKYKTSKETL